MDVDPTHLSGTWWRHIPAGGDVHHEPPHPADNRWRRGTVAFAELLIALDKVRAGSKISKAELARRVGVKPSVISRLLDGKGRNVQLDTVADVADALDVYIEMRVRPQPKGKRARHAPIEVLAA